MGKLTHLDKKGQARMVDVGDKPATAREALAQGRVVMNAGTFRKALDGDSKKGSVRAAAEFAGVMAAKRTAELIPLGDHLNLSKVKVDIAPDKKANALVVTARSLMEDPAGAEMEAFTAVEVVCL